MTSATAPARARRRAPRRGSPRRRAAVRRGRRRLLLLLGLLGLAGVVWIAASPLFRDAVREIELPLHHEDIIRQQAAEKNLDPALLASMIDVESKFVDRTSAAGAQGLMQLMPGTARFIARKSGGTRFELSDLATPQVNIAYGAWYLRYLLDRYRGNVVLAIAAYNGGEANVDRWVREAARSGRTFTTADIPFPETRAYVDRVLSARGRYARTYAKELGLAR
jgi:soluble lytic murein transglycosylase